MEKVAFLAWWHCYMDGAIFTTYNEVMDHMKETGHIDFQIHRKEINT